MPWLQEDRSDTFEFLPLRKGSSFTAAYLKHFSTSSLFRSLPSNFDNLKINWHELVIPLCLSFLFYTADNHFKCLLQGTNVEWEGWELKDKTLEGLRAVIMKNLLEILDTCNDSGWLSAQWTIGFDTQLINTKGGEIMNSLLLLLPQVNVFGRLTLIFCFAIRRLLMDGRTLCATISR